MKRLRLDLLFALLAVILLPALKVPAEGRAGTSYRLEYSIRGGAISRLLFIFPLRVFYEASAAVDLTAISQEDGSICFAFARVPRTCFILRTLGFSGKTLALLTVGENEDGSEAFAEEILSLWRSRTPEFAERIKTVKKFSHLLAPGSHSFAFERDAAGFYRDFLVGLEPRYRHYPAKTGLYFKVFPMLANLLKLLNHRFLPSGSALGGGAVLPAEWDGDELDFSSELNQAAGLLEKQVKSLVAVDQKFPFRLRFHVVSAGAEEIEICGEGHPDVPLWKGFMLREVFRRVRLRPADRELLSDEIWMGIRNAKGQGGFGRLLLKKIDAKEK